jgi:hypothetical protein
MPGPGAGDPLPLRASADGYFFLPLTMEGLTSETM